MPKRFYVDSLPSKSAPVVRNVMDRTTDAVIASFPPEDREGAFALRNTLNGAPSYAPLNILSDDGADTAPRFYVDSHGPKGARTHGYDVCDRDAGEIVLSFASDKRTEAFALRDALRAAESAGGQ